MSFHTIEYSPNMSSSNTNQPLGLSGAQTGGIPPAGIFTYDGGIPMLFFVPFNDPNRSEYKQKIISHGGIITDTEPNESTANRIVLLSSYNIRGQMCFKLSFIDDSIRNGGVCDLNNYKHEIPGLHDTSSISGRNKIIKINADGEVDKATFTDVLTRNVRPPPTRTSRRFDNVKDDYILKQVRLNPRLRNSHKFFDELATHNVLKGHTGNSIRSRYRNHLESRLAYIYKTDEDGSLIKDAEGKPVEETLEHLPKTLKNRFTAREDYHLCNELIEYSKAKYLEDLESGSVEKDGNGKPKEFDYYSEFTAPVSFFAMLAKKRPSHSYHSWRDRYRKFVRPYGAQKFIDDFDESVRKGEVPEQMKNFTGKKAGIARGFKQLIGSNYSSAYKDLPLTSSKEDDGVIDEKIKEMKPSGYNDVVDDNIDPRTSHESVPVNTHPTETQESSVNFDSQGLSQGGSQLRLDIKYAPKDVTIEDLFNEKFYKIKPEQISLQVQHILHNYSNDFSRVFQEFNGIGINGMFTAHIVMATSSDIVGIQIFIDKFLNLIQHLQEDEIYKGLFIEDTNGLWTPKLDGYLTSNSKSDLKKLKKIQSGNSIDLRRNFFERLTSFQ